ncbi:MAG TPA: cation:proton antiporter [Alphaproteobacteria bacterium]|nr:cation:proton antiporter [Alphaproteobacteria bacterium]
MNSVLTHIALVAVAALLGGIILTRLRQPAILGYVLAGVILGPSGLGFVKNIEGIDLLAHLGILLLLFVIGLELDLQSFKKKWKISLIIVGLQIFISLFLIGGTAKIFGASTGLCILLGFIGALSSTAVAVKLLESANELHTPLGQSILGILIAQDLAFVPMILLVRGFGGGGFSSFAIVKVLISIGFLSFLIFFLQKKRNYKVPFASYIKQNNDMIPLSALAFCFALASLAGILGLSAAYGAFIAGLIMGSSHYQKTLVQATHSIQSILMMVFFLSIGLLLDLKFIYENLGLVLVLLVLVSLVKTILNIGILHFLKFSWRPAFLSGVIIAQLGEFSFLLAGVGGEIKLLDEKGTKYVVALTALSLIFSPIWLHCIRRFKGMKFNQSLTFKEFMKKGFSGELSHLGKIRRRLKSFVGDVIDS